MQVAKKLKPAAKTANSRSGISTGGRRTQVRESGIHGKVLEYKGEIITWKKAEARHPHDASQPNHTFYFHLDDGHVIDAKHIGNSAKWINHSCKPNLEVEQNGYRIFLNALRDIKIGEELSYDYGLVIDIRKTARVKKDFACRCGATGCRGTMLNCK
jgi:hypothetical protein